MAKFHFKGLMAAVLTPFTEDNQVNYDMIDGYCKFLKTNGVHGALVNGTSGEGTCLRLDERKRLAESWQEACRKYGVTLMVQIGGADILTVSELAQHAEKIGVDCVLCLPELYFKPKTEESLVSYIKGIARHCPNTPFYYYEIPRMSGVNLNMIRFYDLIEKEVPTFRGLKYSSDDMQIAVDLMKEGRNIILGSKSTLWAALNLGADGAILPTLNLCPEIINDIYQSFLDGKLKEGLAAQLRHNQRVDEIVSQSSGEWIECLKQGFNRVHKPLNVGTTRKPNTTSKRI